MVNLQIPNYSKFLEILNNRNYSGQTVKNYIVALHLIYNWFLKENKSIINASLQDFKEYFSFLIEKEKVSITKLRRHRFILELYYKEVLDKNISLDFIKGIKNKDRNLIILSRKEVNKIISSCENPKYKLIFNLMYFSGLKIGEIVILKVGDILIKNKNFLIFKKNKFIKIIMPNKIIINFISFIKKRKNKEILFKSDLVEKPISIRTIQKNFQKSVDKSKINKIVSTKDLRHSLAVHLLQEGKDIQNILGYQNKSTTLFYEKLLKKQQ